jgi:hypothetical protein
MQAQHIPQQAISGRRMYGGWALGLIAVALLGLLIAGRMLFTTSAVTPQEHQPVVGQHTVVSGLVFDGTRYTSAPIAVGASALPVIGRHTTVTGLVFDGTRYTSAPIAVGAEDTQGSYSVTGLVFDGTRYISAPVQVRSR